MSTLIEGLYYERLECGRCGIVFYAPHGWVVDRRDRGHHNKEFHCPNGHPRVWQEAEVDKVRRERDRLKQDAARLEQERADAIARADAERERARKIVAREKKLRKRASAGTCPCCSRTFSNMAVHMKKQHPGFTAEPPKLSVVA